jgi:hypothetical protein
MNGAAADGGNLWRFVIQCGGRLMRVVIKLGENDTWTCKAKNVKVSYARCKATRR